MKPDKSFGFGGRRNLVPRPKKRHRGTYRTVNTAQLDRLNTFKGSTTISVDEKNVQAI